jgi:hypothetical protein
MGAPAEFLRGRFTPRPLAPAAATAPLGCVAGTPPLLLRVMFAAVATVALRTGRPAAAAPLAAAGLSCTGGPDSPTPFSSCCCCWRSLSGREPSRGLTRLLPAAAAVPAGPSKASSGPPKLRPTLRTAPAAAGAAFAPGPAAAGALAGDPARCAPAPAAAAPANVDVAVLWLLALFAWPAACAPSMGPLGRETATPAWAPAAPAAAEVARSSPAGPVPCFLALWRPGGLAGSPSAAADVAGPAAIEASRCSCLKGGPSNLEFCCGSLFLLRLRPPPVAAGRRRRVNKHK